MFTIVHAGDSYADRGGFTIYVKMRKRKGEYRELRTPNGIFVSLRDRDIYLTRVGLKETGMPSFIEGYDFAINADFANPNSAVPDSSVMFIPKKNNFRIDKSIFPPRRMILDSGGFLLMTGQESFYDPLDIAKRYNRYANYGMALDIPLGHPKGQTMERVIFHAHVQRLNTNIIKKHLNKDVILYNISHGANPEFRTEYMNIVKDKDLDHWACAGSMGTIFDRIFNTLLTIDVAGRKSLKSIHILGIADTRYIPILAWLGKYVDVTSDASTAIHRAFLREFNEIRESTLYYTYLGHNLRKQGKIRTHTFESMLGCNCGVCYALGTTECFQNIPYGSHLYTLALSLHNQNIYDEYTKAWNAMAKEYTVKEYKEEFNRLLTRQNRHILYAIDFIEEWTHSTALKVAKKYKAYLMNTHNHKLANRGDPRSFNLIAGPQEEKIPNINNITAVCKRYMKYHSPKLDKYGKYLLKK